MPQARNIRLSKAAGLARPPPNRWVKDKRGQNIRFDTHRAKPCRPLAADRLSSDPCLSILGPGRRQSLREARWPSRFLALPPSGSIVAARNLTRGSSGSEGAQKVQQSLRRRL